MNKLMECNCVICVVQINLVSIQHALGCQSEKNLISFVQLSQNIKGVELLMDVVNSTHVWIILFHSFQVYDCFTIDMFSPGVYYYCLKARCQHAHYFLLIARRILIRTIFTYHYRFSIWWFVEHSSTSCSDTFTISLEKSFLFFLTVPHKCIWFCKKNIAELGLV